MEGINEAKRSLLRSLEEIADEIMTATEEVERERVEKGGERRHRRKLI